MATSSCSDIEYVETGKRIGVGRVMCMTRDSPQSRSFTLTMYGMEGSSKLVNDLRRNDAMARWGEDAMMGRNDGW